MASSDFRTEEESITDTNSTYKLTSEQKQKIEANKQKALELKRERHLSGNTGTSVSEFKRINVSKKLIDTGGGFLLSENEFLEGEKKKICIIEKPPPILPPDQPKCLECTKNFSGSYLLEKFDHPVCDNCRDPTEKHSLITKSDVKKNYLLTDVDLEQRGTPLKFILGKNPHNSRWNDMKLYLLIQVEKRALEIWGSEEKLMEEFDKREEKRTQTKQKTYQKKMKTLRMSIRSSLYTKAFAETHKHEFDEEIYNAEEDTYSHECSSCGFKETYEKM